VTVLWNQLGQTDRTIPNNKPDAITRNNEKGTRMLIDVAVLGERNVIRKEAEKRVKCGDHTIEICKHKSDTITNMGDWNSQNRSENTLTPYGEARDQGTTEHSHTVHCTHTAEYTEGEVRVQSNQRGN